MTQLQIVAFIDLAILLHMNATVIVIASSCGRCHCCAVLLFCAAAYQYVDYLCSS